MVRVVSDRAITPPDSIGTDAYPDYFRVFDHKSQEFVISSFALGEEGVSALVTLDQAPTGPGEVRDTPPPQPPASSSST